jgi:hypothetical protein
MRTISHGQTAWRELTKNGVPAFVIVRPLYANGKTLAPGDPFPGAITERRVRLLYEQHNIAPVVAEQPKVETPKAKKTKKVKT